MSSLPGCRSNASPSTAHGGWSRYQTSERKRASAGLMHWLRQLSSIQPIILCILLEHVPTQHCWRYPQRPLPHKVVLWRCELILVGFEVGLRPISTLAAWERRCWVCPIHWWDYEYSTPLLVPFSSKSGPSCWSFLAAQSNQEAAWVYRSTDWRRRGPTKSIWQRHGGVDRPGE